MIQTNKVHEYLEALVAHGHTEAKFGHLENAKFFKHLLEKKSISTQL
jgi:hypothetical protein